MYVTTILKVKGRSVITVRPDATLHDVAQKLAAKRIGAVVVVGDNGDTCGIISERDIMRAIGDRGAAALTAPVAEFMTRNVVTCSEHTAIEELMETMTHGRFRHVPVTDEDGALVGIISMGDVVRHHIAEVELEVSAMRNYLTAG